MKTRADRRGREKNARRRRPRRKLNGRRVRGAREEHIILCQCAYTVFQQKFRYITSLVCAASPTCYNNDARTQTHAHTHDVTLVESRRDCAVHRFRVSYITASDKCKSSIRLCVWIYIKIYTLVCASNINCARCDEINLWRSMYSRVPVQKKKKKQITNPWRSHRKKERRLFTCRAVIIVYGDIMYGQPLCPDAETLLSLDNVTYTPKWKRFWCFASRKVSRNFKPEHSRVMHVTLLPIARLGESWRVPAGADTLRRNSISDSRGPWLVHGPRHRIVTN